MLKRMPIFGNKNSYYYFNLLKSIYKYPGLINKYVFFTLKRLSGIKYSDENLLKLVGSKHASEFLRSITS